MRNNSIISIITYLCLAVGTVQAQGVLSLSLHDAIRQAQDSSLMAFAAQHYWQAQQWGYQAYLASRGPLVEFAFNPSYLKQNHQADLDHVSASDVNMLAVGAGVNYSQQVAPLGGYLYANTRVNYSEYLGDMRDTSPLHRQMGTQPIRIGYKQELVGWNAFKWQKRIAQSNYEKAQHTLTYQLLQIAERTSAYYFNYLNCRQYRNIYEQNYHTADTLFIIGQRKAELTMLNQEEVMSLDLEVRNARNQLQLSETQMDNARRSLLSYLHQPDLGQELQVVVPEVPSLFDIDLSSAIELALQHNPEVLEMDHGVLEAESELDEARHRSGFKMGLDMSVGLQNHGYEWSQAFGHQKTTASVGLSISIPLYDGGMARKRKMQAASALRAAEMQASEQRRKLEDEVREVVNTLQTQHSIMSNAQESVELADEAFALIRKRYADGLIDMNSYQFAMNRKDQAHQIYINLLSNFWSNYFKLCRLTMYDYMNNEPL